MEKFIVRKIPMVNIQSGMKPRARTVLMKVMVMDMLMSPFRRRVQKLDPVPPGQQPSTNNPNLKWRLFAIVWSINIYNLKSISSVMAQPMK